MAILSTVDQLADICCNLPVDEANGRLDALEVLVGHRLESSVLTGDKLRIRLHRAGDDDLEAKVAAWAEAEKGCCGFLGFAIESEPQVVVLEISAPGGAAATLEGFDSVVQAAGQAASAP